LLRSNPVLMVIMFVCLFVCLFVFRRLHGTACEHPMDVRWRGHNGQSSLTIPRPNCETIRRRASAL
jgi:hypothetical protein